jgi:hypothetical protein
MWLIVALIVIALTGTHLHPTFDTLEEDPPDLAKLVFYIMLI